MTPRTPSFVPFLILLVVGALLCSFLPLAIVMSNATWATLLILGATAISAMLIGLTRLWESGLQFSPILTACLWLIPLLYGAFQKNPLALLALVPIWRNLSLYLPEGTPPPRHAFIASVLAQVSLVVALTGNLAFAIILASVALALILWAKEPHATKPLVRIPSAILAILIAFVLFSPPPPPGPGTSTVRSTVIAKNPTSPRAGSSDEAHLGIVVRPEVKREDKKLPPPPNLRPADNRISQSIPIDIPFSGVYWIFQRPLIAPPASSPEFKGAPADYKFHSDDATPLRLDAYQRFGVNYPTRRIRAIDVKLRSTDTEPESLWLQLNLLNSQVPQYRTNLGEHLIEVTSDTQTFHYEVPPSASVDEFDEIMLRVKIHFRREQIAPRIAIQSFRLYPR